MSSPRIAGVDVARGLALLGMMAAHVLVISDPVTGEPTLTGWLATGRPSALFALLAGVGLALMTGGPRPARDPTRVRWNRSVIATRAGLVVLTGLLLAMLDAGVAIILVHYGVLFILALPFLRLRARALWSIAAGWVVLAPVLYWALHNGLRSTLEGFPDYWRLWHSPTPLDLADPALLGMDLALTGYYPLLLWPAYLFAGMAAGRSDPGSRAVAVRLLVIGGLLAIISQAISLSMIHATGLLPGYAQRFAQPEGMVRGELLTGTHTLPLITDARWFLLATPHEGSTMDLVHTLGCALAVLGACLLMLPALRTVLTPLAGAGAMPLTLYAGHLLILFAWRGELAPSWAEEVSPAMMMASLTVLALAGGLVKAHLGRRGPLESLIHSAGTTVAGPRPPGP